MIHQMTVQSQSLIIIRGANTLATSHATIIQSLDTLIQILPLAIQHTAFHMERQTAQRPAQFQLNHSYQNHTETSLKMQIQMRHPRSNLKQ